MTTANDRSLEEIHQSRVDGHTLVETSSGRLIATLDESARTMWVQSEAGRFGARSHARLPEFRRGVPIFRDREQWGEVRTSSLSLFPPRRALMLMADDGPTRLALRRRFGWSEVVDEDGLALLRRNELSGRTLLMLGCSLEKASLCVLCWLSGILNAASPIAFLLARV